MTTKGLKNLTTPQTVQDFSFIMKILYFLLQNRNHFFQQNQLFLSYK